MSIEDYFKDWMKVIDKRKLIGTLNVLSKIYTSGLVYPTREDIFKAFKLCSLNNLKIVMLCQDPYPQKGVATGIALGNSKETEEEDLSPSLQILREAAINFEIPHNSIIFDNSLESWEKQGVLMLNSALTVMSGKPGSHAMLWRPFISSLLKNLSNKETGIIYVLLGAQAKSFKPYINSKYNTILEERHPAYYARMNKSMSSELFNKINECTYNLYGEHIKWYEEY